MKQNSEVFDLKPVFEASNKSRQGRRLILKNSEVSLFQQHPCHEDDRRANSFGETASKIHDGVNMSNELLYLVCRASEIVARQPQRLTNWAMSLSDKIRQILGRRLLLLLLHVK